ncbi:MAG TPA: GNAT family N-acetyltransferase [Candidatus Sulfomarinibacteraceae bacterium]|nr:GNAT family N-acetyltransferase [Candidatus Sulfomarinibacteraceae bacterium]
MTQQTTTRATSVQRRGTKDRSLALNIRPFDYTDADYEALVAVCNAIEPERPSSVPAYRHWDNNRESQYHFRRYLAELNGQVVATAATGHAAWSHQPHKFFVNVQVLPEHQGKGIGARMYARLLAHLEPREPRKLVSYTREHRENAIRFLKRRGFRQVMRIPVSTLDPATFDNERFALKVHRVLDSGITIKTLQEVSEQDPDWKRKLYDLEWECVQDVPSTDPFTRRSFETFENAVLQSPNLLPDAWFVAVDGERYVGLSVLWRNLVTDKLLETGLTGVVRSHRRRGIATAMKVRAIEYAQANGNPLIDTDNEENNPMFQLNLQLGFVPQPAHLDFEMKLADETSDTASSNGQRAKLEE